MACYIFGAGSYFGLIRRPAPEDTVIAADGGWRICREEGIVPDLEIPFERPREEDADEPRILLREQNLSGHLENADGGKKATSSKKRDDAAEQLARDNQLRMALQLVKGLPRIQEIRR